MNKLSGKLLLQSIQEGSSRVILHKNELNSINVFPIADGDTGNNLASMMRSFLEIEVDTSIGIKEVLDRIAMQSIESGKGNSGMIFAQYLNGIARGYKESEDSIGMFIYSLEKALEEAYIAIANPQEGTILTVMKEWTYTLKNSIKENSFMNALTMAQERAYNALLETKHQHKIMRKNKVIDAGAKGFYLFIEGMSDVLRGDKILKDSFVDDIGRDEKEEKIFKEELHDVSQYQYCMECIVVKSDTVTNLIKSLEEYGDSIVNMDGKDLTKIHIHTNTPHEVLNHLQSIGNVTRIKIDDMHQQYFDAHHNKKTTAILTDSIADIPKDVIKKYNIHILPLTILIEETEHLDTLTITNKEVFRIQDQNISVTSSLPGTNTINRYFEHLEMHYENVIYISVSSGLSGSYNAVKKATEVYTGKLNIFMIDSQLNSIAQGLLVKQAGSYVSENMDVTDIVNKLEKDILNIEILVSVSDLEAMIRSGRIPKKAGQFLKKIKLYPTVSLKNGVGSLFGVSRNRKALQKKIIKKVQKDNREIKEIIIGYTDDLDYAKYWVEPIERVFNQTPPLVETSNIIALGAGKQAVAIAIQYKEEKQK